MNVEQRNLKAFFAAEKLSGRVDNSVSLEEAHLAHAIHQDQKKHALLGVDLELRAEHLVH